MSSYNNEKLSFGIDLGISSVGWSVVDLETSVIKDKGVYLFSEAEKAEERRQFRSNRRRKKRRLHRIERLNLLFSEYEIQEKNSYDSDLLKNRLRAIKEKVSMQDIVNIIMYFARHRGYIQFKDEDERKSEIVDELRNKNYLACEIQKNILEENNKYRGDEYLLQHTDYMKELDVILNKQSEYYEKIDDTFIKKVKEIINSKRKFWEGPGGPVENQLNKYGRYKTIEDLEKYKNNKNYNKYLFENLIGNCSVYIGEKRASNLNFYAECFNFYNDMVNLRINLQDLDETNMKYFKTIDKDVCKLSSESIKMLKDEVLKSKSVNYQTLFKKIFMVDFSKIYGYKKDKDGNAQISKFEFIRKIKNKIEDQTSINELLNNMEAYNIAVHLIQVSPDSKTRYEILKDNLSNVYSDKLITLLSELKIDDNKYHSFSEKALKIYLELMEENNENSSYIEREFKELIHSDVEEEIINRYIGENIEKGNLKYINSKYIDDIVASPATKKSLRKSISVINKLFSKYGYPQYICIENTRQLLSDKKQREYEAQTLDNQLKRKNAIKKLRELGYEETDSNIDKILLIDETNGKCAYCNRDITVGNCEVEHILPKSKTANDTFLNKTVSCTQCNCLKNNRSPYEFLINQNLYDDFKIRVQKNNNFAQAKKDNLLFELSIDKYEKSFKNRNLNDTAYATNELANQINLFKKAYIKHNYGEILETRVLRIPGQFTGILRKNADLQKNRELDYHHAVDASIVATIPKLKIGKLIDMIQNDKDKYWKLNNIKDYGENLYDELYLKKQIKEQLQKTDFSNTRFAQEVQKKKSGPLFNADISKVVMKEGEYYKIEQINNIYNILPKDIEKFFPTNKYFLCKDNNPELYKRIYEIINMYKGKKVNPFVEYCKENNIKEGEKFDYRKHGIRQSSNPNSSVVVRLRFLTKVNVPYILSNDKLIKTNKVNKKDPILMYDSLKSYCTRIYKDKETGKLLFMPIYKIFIDNNSGEIRTNSEYYKLVFKKYVNKELYEVEKYMDLFNNEYVKFYKNDEYVGEGLVSGFHKTNNTIIVKKCNKNISSKITKIEKIKFDVLGLYNLNI